jgi:hypothetical protein
MSITTTIQAALAAIATAHADLAVTVKYGAQTATGLRVLTDKQTTDTVMGQAGSILGTVRVSSASISEPERGAQLVVGGTQVYVINCRTSGGVRVIQYSETQPVEGV